MFTSRQFTDYVVLCIITERTSFSWQKFSACTHLCIELNSRWMGINLYNLQEHATYYFIKYSLTNLHTKIVRMIQSKVTIFCRFMKLGYLKCL